MIADRKKGILTVGEGAVNDPYNIPPIDRRFLFGGRNITTLTLPETDGQNAREVAFWGAFGRLFGFGSDDEGADNGNNREESPRQTPAEQNTEQLFGIAITLAVIGGGFFILRSIK